MPDERAKYLYHESQRRRITRDDVFQDSPPVKGKPRYKAGIRDDIETTKLELIELVDGDERENWQKAWFMRSAWEANVGRLLLHLRQIGELLLLEYESVEYDFMKDPDYSGSRQSSLYRPDYHIHLRGDDESRDMEVKGRLWGTWSAKLSHFKGQNFRAYRRTLFVVWRNSKTHTKLIRRRAEMFWFYQDLAKQWPQYFIE